MSLGGSNDTLYWPIGAFSNDQSLCRKEYGGMCDPLDLVCGYKYANVPGTGYNNDDLWNIGCRVD